MCMVLMYSQYKLKRGDKAPSFALKGVDGKVHSLEEFKGMPVLVIFMCNHCPYVKPKFPYLVELQEKYKGKLQIIGINPNDAEKYPEDSFEKMKEYAERFGFNFLYLRDETQEVAKAYGAVCTPDPFLLDREHRIAYHGRIDDAHGKPHSEATTSELEEAIEQVLEGKEVSIPSLPSCGCSIKWKTS